MRLYGELRHWPKLWFATDPGGGGALVGISWLPVVFGPYFAARLAAAGNRPSSVAKAGGFGLLQPMFAKLPFAKKYFYVALLPQMTLHTAFHDHGPDTDETVRLRAGG